MPVAESLALADAPVKAGRLQERCELAAQAR